MEQLNILDSRTRINVLFILITILKNDFRGFEI